MTFVSFGDAVGTNPINEQIFILLRKMLSDIVSLAMLDTYLFHLLLFIFAKLYPPSFGRL